ncbi:MAG: hypothetical protein MUO87_07190, partial [Thermoplasmata archaeon]|nr:hypothetical protein [Thermoplasmata archaeon]
MSARTLQFVFSAASVCISSAIFVIALTAAVQSGDGASMDFSQGRGLVAALSVVFLAASVYILVRSLPERLPTVPGASSAMAGLGQTAGEAGGSATEPKDDDERILRTLPADEL